MLGARHAWASLMAQWVKSLPAMQETQETRVLSLSEKDPLEEEMATHCSILAWRNPTDRGAWWATVHGVAKSQTGLSDHVVSMCVCIQRNIQLFFSV